MLPIAIPAVVNCVYISCAVLITGKGVEVGSALGVGVSTRMVDCSVGATVGIDVGAIFGKGVACVTLLC